MNISSDNGSISRKMYPGKYGYSASKAALNMMTKILSVELRSHGILVVSLHPGWVKTSMTRKENAPLEPSDSIGGMMQVIESLGMKTPGDSLTGRGMRSPGRGATSERCASHSAGSGGPPYGQHVRSETHAAGIGKK